MTAPLCTLCDRWKCFYDTYGKNNLKGVGDENADIMLVGECYSDDNEANTGIPFVGASGKMLNEMLLYAGVQREDVFITNALRCWHPDNKTPSVREIKNCRPYLLNEINTVKPKIIIAIGRIPMTALGIKEDQSAAVGKLHKSPYTTVPVFAIYHPAYILRNRKLKDTNFEYFKKGVESIGKKIINGLVTDNYYVVRTVCQAKKARDFLLGRKFISYDAEASGLDYFNTKNPVFLKSVAFGFNQGKAIVFPTTPDVFPKEEDRKEVIQYIKEILESDVLKTAHNAKWDNGLFLVMGIKVKHLYIDTILAAHQLDENAAKDLDSCVLRYVPEMAGYSNVIKEKYKGKPHKAHGEDLWFYNAGDADATLRLAKLFYKKLREDNMWWLHKNVLVPATECFIRMENHGVKCDRDLMKELEKKYIEDHKRISKEIKEIPEVIQFEQLTGQYYNSASPSHNKKMFIEIYKLPVIKESEITKQPSIDKDVLTVYAEKHNNELARKVRELSLIEKVLSTYLTGFYKYLYKDDIAHTQINLDVTVTGRTSSGGGGKTKEDEMESFKIVDVDAAQRKAPNLQNIPKRNLALRNIIKARDNRYLIGQDFAQSEVGCVAAISKDQKLIKAYMEGTDLHSQIAATIFGVKLEEVTKEQRNNAKFCLGKNSFVATSSGLKRPFNLNKNDQLLTKELISQNYNMCIENTENTLVVTFNSGIVEEYRPDHKLLIWKGNHTDWKTVKDLTTEDEIISVYGYLSDEHKEKTIDISKYYTQNRIKSKKLINISDPDWCYFFGLYLGDGCISFIKSKSNEKDIGGMIRIVIKNEKTKDKIFTLMDNYNITYSIAKQCIAKKGFTYYYVTITSFGLSKLLLELFPNKDISDFFIEFVDFKGFKELLSGLMDSDGTIKQGLKILCNTNKNLINKVALISSAIGIPTRVKKYKAGITTNGARRYHYKNNTDKNYKDCYELAFHEIYETITCLDPRKQGNFRKKYDGFSVEETFADNVYKEVLKLEGGYSKKSKAVVTWDNLRRIKSKVTPKTPYLHLIPELKNNFYITKIVDKTPNTSKIYVIQTEKKHYISSSVVSHNCTFGILYGISPKGLAKRTGWDEIRSAAMLNKYFETFPQLDRYMKDVVRQVDIRQWVESPLHRRRRFPLVDNRAYRQAMNQPTQSLSSDLLIYGLVILDKLIEEQNLYEHITPILAVHDEICVEAETGYVVKAIELIKQAFTKDLYKNKFIAEVMGKIRLGIDMKISPCGGGWGAYLPLSTYDDTILNRIDKGELVIDLDLKLKETDLTTPKKRAIG